jgi:hypothetical protein
MASDELREHRSVTLETVTDPTGQPSLVRVRVDAPGERAVSAIVRLDELDDGVAGILGGGASQRIRGQA